MVFLQHRVTALGFVTHSFDRGVFSLFVVEVAVAGADTSAAEVAATIAGGSSRINNKRTTMAAQSREEFLSHFHQPRSNNAGPGPPTKSTIRYRWRELRRWAVEEECRAYWEALSAEDKAKAIDAPVGFWGLIEVLLESSSEPLATESGLKIPFGNFFQSPHNIANRVQGMACHVGRWLDCICQALGRLEDACKLF